MSVHVSRFYGHQLRNYAREAVGAALRISKHRRGPRWFAGAGPDAGMKYWSARRWDGGCSSTLRKAAKLTRIFSA
jgi:hypothetical protein